jgi:hypothetical protein
LLLAVLLAVQVVVALVRLVAQEMGHREVAAGMVLHLQ